MAHLIERMAYVGEAPGMAWAAASPKQPLEVWHREAGMDWQIQESPVHFKADAVGHLGSIHSFPEQKVLYRSDTKAPLSVVSQRYQVVQPRKYWSSTATSPRSPATSWKPPACSRAVASSGRWRAPDRTPR